jgi:hypothetical protein
VASLEADMKRLRLVLNGESEFGRSHAARLEVDRLAREISQTHNVNVNVPRRGVLARQKRRR